MKQQITLDDIKSIDHNKLADLLYGMIDTDRLLHTKIENILLAENPKELEKSIKKSIASIKRGRKFIDYRESLAFADKASAIVDDIVMLVSDKKSASKLLKELIATDSKVYCRSDDSAGYIQYAYARAENTWKEYAVETLSDNELLKDLEALLICDGFGLRNIFSEMMPKSVLKNLYDTYKLQYISKTSPYSQSETQSILREIAHTMKEPELYIDTLTLDGEALYDYQILDIAKEYQNVGDAENTLVYLNQLSIERYRADEIYKIYIWAYEALNKPLEVTLVYKQWYEMTKSAKILLQYLARVDGDMYDKEKARALRDVESLTFGHAIEFYRALDEKALCASFVRNRQDEIDTRFLDMKHIASWLEEEYPQEVILLYRSVAEDNLSSSQSKYYPHAVKVLKKISVIENQHDRSEWYLTSNAAFITALREKHAKKSKLMALLDQAFGK